MVRLSLASHLFVADPNHIVNVVAIVILDPVSAFIRVKVPPASLPFASRGRRGSCSRSHERNRGGGPSIATASASARRNRQRLIEQGRKLRVALVEANLRENRIVLAMATQEAAPKLFLVAYIQVNPGLHNRRIRRT